MHFRVTGAFTFVFVFLSILSIASPLSPRINVVLDELDVRQISSIFESIIRDIAEGIIKNIIKDIVEFNDNAHAVERNFTQEMINSLWQKYPGNNSLVFHNQNSRLFDASPDLIHTHQEVDKGNILGWELTQGYEVYVFDSGTFLLAGDGGFENYCYQGCSSRGPRTPAVSTPAVIFTKPNATCPEGP